MADRRRVEFASDYDSILRKANHPRLDSFTCIGKNLVKFQFYKNIVEMTRPIAVSTSILDISKGMKPKKHIFYITTCIIFYK